MTKRTILTLLVGGVALLGAAILAVSLLAPLQNPSDSRQVAETPSVGGPFQMVDTTGAPVSQADLQGKPTVLFFGFTYCPDVCPTTLYELTTLIQQLGSDADKLNYVFVSVDAERDTPEQLRQYLSVFDPRIRGFTGTPEQVDTIARAYRVYYKKVPTPDGGYTMDHTATTYLMGADGKFIGTISYQEDQGTALAKLKRLAGLKV